jgi:hypothetical protein
LEGQLVFHDSIRKWFELKLDQAQCGQTSIEMEPAKTDNWTPLEILRGCRVRSTGALDLSSTGYYSLDLYQAVGRIEPVGACMRQSPLPDYSKAKPGRSVRHYRVDMHVTYGHGNHPVIFRVSSGGKELRPWQAYARYEMTGDFVLYGYCADGFVLNKVFGTPQAHPSHFDEETPSDDWAAFDPESAAASGKKDLHLGYTCVRRELAVR